MGYSKPLHGSLCSELEIVAGVEVEGALALLQEAEEPVHHAQEVSLRRAQQRQEHEEEQDEGAELYKTEKKAGSSAENRKNSRCA